MCVTYLLICSRCRLVIYQENVGFVYLGDYTFDSVVNNCSYTDSIATLFRNYIVILIKINQSPTQFCPYSLFKSYLVSVRVYLKRKLSYYMFLMFHYGWCLLTNSMQ